jgi:hypothetical protein
LRARVTEQPACDQATLPQCGGRESALTSIGKRPKRWLTEIAGEMLEFVEFSQAMFRAGATEAERSREEAGLLGSLVYRPTVFRRNHVRWIATCAWRTRAKADDIVALKRAK